MVARFTRSLLALAIAATTLIAPSVATAGSTAQEHFAVVRITIQQADGQVARATKTVRWGDAASFELATGGHAHRVAIAPQDGNRIEVDYARDGSDVLTDAEVDTAGRGPTVVHQDAASTVTVRIVRTAAQLQSQPL